MSSTQPKACLNLIKYSQGKLFHAQQKIASFVLENPEKVIRMSIREVARNTGVSEATVIRFVQTIGYQGYKEFRIALASDLSLSVGSEKLDIIHEAVALGDQPFSILKKIFSSSMHSFKTTLNYMEENDFEESANVLLQAGKILMVAVGNSRPIAMDALHRFLKLDKLTLYSDDPVAGALYARLLTFHDVVFGISYSGQSIDVIEILKIAKDKGAKVIALTSYEGTSLSDLADVTLIARSQETQFRTEAMESRIVMFSIIDALYIAMAMHNPEKTLRALRESTNPLKYKKLIP